MAEARLLARVRVPVVVGEDEDSGLSGFAITGIIFACIIGLPVVAVILLAVGIILIDAAKGLCALISACCKVANKCLKRCGGAIDSGIDALFKALVARQAAARTHPEPAAKAKTTTIPKPDVEAPCKPEAAVPEPATSCHKVEPRKHSDMPFQLLSHGSRKCAVCNAHSAAFCNLGCKTDFSLMNQLANSAEYKALQDNPSERLDFTKRFVLDYLNRLRKARTEGSSGLSKPTNAVAATWAKKAELAEEEPTSVIWAFASICYAKRSDHSPVTPSFVKLSDAAAQYMLQL